MQNQKSTIKAVCFDLDGVYFTPESFQRFKKTISNGANAETLSDVLYRSEQMQNFKKGKISENEFWDFVRDALKINLTNDQIFKKLRDSYETNPDIVQSVRSVRQNGFKTAICSNNFVTRIRELNKKFDFLKDFDVQVFSYEVGVTKPDKQIFEVLAERSNVNPSEILYSDDSPVKLVGAKEIGIHTFVFETVEEFLKKLRRFGVIDD